MTFGIFRFAVRIGDPPVTVDHKLIRNADRAKARPSLPTRRRQRIANCGSNTRPVPVLSALVETAGPDKRCAPPPGRHAYQFVIDGDRWIADPNCEAKDAEGHSVLE